MGGMVGESLSARSETEGETGSKTQTLTIISRPPPPRLQNVPEPSRDLPQARPRSPARISPFPPPRPVRRDPDAGAVWWGFVQGQAPSAGVWIGGGNAGGARRGQVMADPPGGGGSRACVCTGRQVEAAAVAVAAGLGLGRREQGREGGC